MSSFPQLKIREEGVAKGKRRTDQPKKVASNPRSQTGIELNRFDSSAQLGDTAGRRGGAADGYLAEDGDWRSREQASKCGRSLPDGDCYPAARERGVSAFCKPLLLLPSGAFHPPLHDCGVRGTASGWGANEWVGGARTTNEQARGARGGAKGLDQHHYSY